MIEPYIDYCVDCGEEFLKTGNRMIRCSKCQKERSRKLNNERSKELYHRKYGNSYIKKLAKTTGEEL